MKNNLILIPIAVVLVSVAMIFIVATTLFDDEKDNDNNRNENDNDDNGENELIEVNGNLIIYIDGKKIDVNWENNNSIKELKKIAKNGLEISMEKYGGFEQVGSLTQNLPSNDSRLTSKPGDIFLYSGDKIVIFYGENSYSYTKLGKINNMSDDEIRTMLDKNSVKLKIVIEE